MKMKSMSTELLAPFPRLLIELYVLPPMSIPHVWNGFKDCLVPLFTPSHRIWVAAGTITTCEAAMTFLAELYSNHTF